MFLIRYKITFEKYFCELINVNVYDTSKDRQSLLVYAYITIPKIPIHCFATPFASCKIVNYVPIILKNF